jgi:hypothetical protein
MKDFSVSRMGTLGASRSAVTDVIFTAPRPPAKPSPWEGITGCDIGRALATGRAAKRPKREPLPRLIARERNPGIGDASPMDDELPTLTDGAKDSAPEPSMLTFFNGKPHAEGLKAYNQYLASTGRGPISAGKR